MRKPLFTVICFLLVASMAIPGLALAKAGGNGQGNAKGVQAGEEKPGKGRSTVATSAKDADKPASAKGKAAEKRADASEKKAEKKADAAVKQAEKKAATEAKRAEKEAAAEAKRAEKAAEVAAVEGAEVGVASTDEPPVSVVETEPVDPDESTVETEPVDPEDPEDADKHDKAGKRGIGNAFSRITANLERSLAKIAAGKKTQLPPGLVRVWMKFAAWLGVDPATRPGYEAPPEEPGSEEPTGTVDPVPSEEPTDTVEPTSTVEPTATVEPTGTVEP